MMCLAFLNNLYNSILLTQIFMKRNFHLPNKIHRDQFSDLHMEVTTSEAYTCFLNQRAKPAQDNCLDPSQVHNIVLVVNTEKLTTANQVALKKTLSQTDIY